MKQSIDQARRRSPATQPARGAGTARRRLGGARARDRSGARRRRNEKVLTEALVLRDPDIPVAGNADGDINIVEYFDYNCPYCRKIDPNFGRWCRTTARSAWC